MPDPATDTGSSGSYDASFGAMAADASRATKAYADVTREKVAAEGATERQMTQRGEEDRLRSVEAFKNEGIKPDELKPWNAEIEHKKFESDPLQGFASSGAVFAMIASAFTKAPMLSAIEGMAGALNGIKEGNEAHYTRAFESYKQNVATAKAKHEIEHQAYTDALALGTHDLALSNAKLRAEASRFGDKQILALADNGMVKEIYDAIAARNKSMESAASLAENTTIRTMQQHALKTSFEQIDHQQGPPGPDGQPTQIPEAVKAAQKLRQINTVYASGKMTQPAQMATAAIIMENPTASVDELTQKMEERHLLPKALKPQEEAAKQGYEAEIAEHQEAGDLTPDKQNEIFKKWFPQTHGGLSNTGKGIDTSMILKRVKLLRDADPGLEETRAYSMAKEQLGAEASGSGAKLNDKTLDQMADQAIAGDTSVFTNLGRGKQGAENVIALRQRIADKLAGAGRTGADQAKAAAAYQGDRAAFRAAGTQEARVGTAAFEAKNMMKIARDESEKVWRTRFVPVNEALQAVERNAGDPEIRAFGAANNSLVNAYVRAISPTGTPTDIVRSHAYELLRTADSKEAYEAILKVMEREMEAAVASPGQFREMMLKTGSTPSRAAEGASVPALGGPGKVIRYDKDGNRVQE